MNHYSKIEISIFSLFCVIAFLSISIGIYSRLYYLFLIPLLILFICYCFVDFKKIYYFLLFLIPITAEYYLPNGFALDLPAEPVMITLMFIYLFYITTKNSLSLDFIKHPVIQVLLVHIFWILITVIFSNIAIIAIKFFLAKLWYIVAFVFLSGLFLKERKNYEIAFWCMLIPLFYTVVLTITKHALLGFDFNEINMAVKPFYRNHVNYATLLALFLPFLWTVTNWYPKQSFQYHFLIACRILFLIAIIFSYTRGAWLAIVAAVGFYFLIQKRLFKRVMIFLITIVIIGSTYLIKDNNYLKYAPDYATTIYHANIKDHLQATKEFKDISSAERFYRWVAAIRMSIDNPITGIGPNNFYHHYKRYTITSFTTYVSNNPEKSGVHNYFLMILTEQGFIGLAIFILLTFSIFHYGIKTYYDTVEPVKKRFVMAVLMSLVIIYVQLLMSDLIEAIKIGTLFFMNIALIVNADLQNRKNKNYF